MIIPKEFNSVVTNSVIFSKNESSLSQFDPKKVFVLPRTLTEEGVCEDKLYPYAVEIHLTSRCQLNCINCSYSSRNKIKDDISQQCVDDIHEFMRRTGAGSLIYSGGGDPLAWPGDLRKLFGTPEPFFRTIATNGVGLDRILFKECIENIDIIQLSLRGYNDEVFSRSANAGKGLFNKIHDNVVKLLEMKQQVKKFPQLTAKIIITRHNYNELPMLFKYCDDLGFDTVVVKLSGNFEEGQDVKINQLELKELYQAVLNIAEAYPEYHYIDSIQLEPHKHYDIEECWVVKLRTNMLVRSNGDVFLCIVSPSSEVNSIGNIERQKIDLIWNSEKHLQIISKLTGDMRSNNCNIEVCRHYRYNYFLDMINQSNSLTAASKEMDKPKLL